jgi:hypothetical protein
MSELAGVIDTLHEIYLPTQLTINECNAEFKVDERSLTLRQRKLLKRGKWTSDL